MGKAREGVFLTKGLDHQVLQLLVELLPILILLLMNIVLGFCYHLLLFLLLLLLLLLLRFCNPIDLFLSLLNKILLQIGFT